MAAIRANIDLLSGSHCSPTKGIKTTKRSIQISGSINSGLLFDPSQIISLDDIALNIPPV